MKFTYIKLLKNNGKRLKKEENEFFNKGSVLDKKNGPKAIKNPLANNVIDKFLKNVLKKNQVALFAIALMLITSGYLNYTNNLKMAALGDARLVSANVTEENLTSNNTIPNEEENNNEENGEYSNNDDNDDEKEDDEDEKDDRNKDDDEDDNEKDKKNNNTIDTGSKINNEEYFTQTRLERDKMYSQMIETYQKILENSNISTEQKNTASEEIKNINNKRNAIATIETLIKGKGISEIVVLVNGDVIDAIVKADNNIEGEQVAQISNIISRELKAEIEDIHITTHK